MIRLGTWIAGAASPPPTPGMGLPRLSYFRLCALSGAGSHLSSLRRPSPLASDERYNAGDQDRRYLNEAMPVAQRTSFASASTRLLSP